MGRMFFGFFIALLVGAELFACNINTASISELTELKGIGKGTAKKIIEYRKAHKFKSIDELMKVKGVGKKKFEHIKQELSV